MDGSCCLSRQAAEGGLFKGARMADNTRLEWTKLILTAVGGIVVFGVGLYQYIATSSHTALSGKANEVVFSSIRASSSAGDDL
jgi:hypothetical protein